MHKLTLFLNNWMILLSSRKMFWNIAQPLMQEDAGRIGELETGHGSCLGAGCPVSTTELLTSLWWWDQKIKEIACLFMGTCDFIHKGAHQSTIFSQNHHKHKTYSSTLKAIFQRKSFLTNNPHTRNAFPLPPPRCRGHNHQRERPQLLEIRSESLGRRHRTQHRKDLRLPREPRLPSWWTALPMRARSCWCEMGLRLDGKRERGRENDKCEAMREDDRVLTMLYGLQFIGDNQKSRGIRSVECQSGMTKQIGCEFGGETSYGNWKYRWVLIPNCRRSQCWHVESGRIPTVAVALAECMGLETSTKVSQSGDERDGRQCNRDLLGRSI